MLYSFFAVRYSLSAPEHAHFEHLSSYRPRISVVSGFSRTVSAVAQGFLGSPKRDPREGGSPASRVIGRKHRFRVPRSSSAFA
jgi:hypothetical protein